MTSLTSTLLSLLIFSVAMLQVRWAGHDMSSLTVVAGDREEDIRECLESSLEARLRFEARLCHRRSMWLDGCEESRSELHTVKFDDITESYRVVSDRFKDEVEPTAVSIPAKSEAVRLATTLHDIPLAFLARGESSLLTDEGAYIQVRTIFVCRGTGTRTFAHLSRIITLGLVNAVEDRSSWSDFNLGVSSDRGRRSKR